MIWISLWVALWSGIAVAGWLYWDAYQYRKALRVELRALEPENYSFGVQIRDAISRLDGRLLRYQLSGEDPSREGFFEDIRGLEVLLAKADAAHSRTHRLEYFVPEIPRADRDMVRLLAGMKSIFEDYLRTVESFLERERRTLRRGTAELVAGEIDAASRPLQEACEQLVAMEHAAWHALVSEVTGATEHQQTRVLLSTVLLFGIFGAIVLLGWRVVVTPLRFELDQRRRASERQESLASLGTIAAGVAHEIRNPLAAIKSQVFEIRRGPVSEEALASVRTVEKEIQRLERIVNDFLQYARPGVPRKQTVDAMELLQSVRDLVARVLGTRGITVDLEATPGVALDVDTDQIRQVLLNLVRNATDSITGAGRITLRARNGMDTRFSPAAPAVMLEVSDTGSGIPATVEGRLFDPFFSTKPGGSGLGLPIAARLVGAHGGHILYQTVPGQGTTFTLVLPRGDSDEAMRPAR